MVRFTVLASGSKGNSTVVTGGHTRILVDAGLSCRELFRRMKLAGEDPATLDAIIVTHEHQDHIAGLAVTARKLGIPVYFTEATHRAWMRWLSPRRQMTYAQWLEQCRQQAAARQAEAASRRRMSAIATSRTRLMPATVSRFWSPLRRRDGEPTPESGSRAEAGSHLAAHRSNTSRPGRPFPDRRHRGQPLHDSARRRRSRWDLCSRRKGVRMALATDLGYVHAQCQGAAERRGSAAAGIQPRPGDAARRPLSLVGEAAGAVAGWSSLQRGHRGVSGTQLRRPGHLCDPGSSLGKQ